MKRIHHKHFNEEFGEDATEFGEFICSYYKWIPPQEQKEKAEKLQNISNKKN